MAPCGDGKHRLWYKVEARQEYLEGLILTATETADGGPVACRHGTLFRWTQQRTPRNEL